MKTVRLSEQIAPHFHDYFLTKKSHVIDYGGRNSGKTSKNILRLIYEIISRDDISVVCMRRHTNNVRRSIYTEVIKGFERLGLSDMIEKTVSPFEVIYKPNGNKVFFSGVDYADKVKGMTADRPIVMLFIDELTEFFNQSYDQGQYLLNNIELTLGRGELGCQFLYTFNPPPNPNHPIYTFLQKNKTNPKYHINRTDYRGLPNAWINQEFIDTAEYIKQNDYPLYEHLYIGEPRKEINKIYNLRPEHVITQEQSRKLYIHNCTLGIDVGSNKSFTTFVLVGFYNNYSGAVVLEEYKHRNFGKLDRDKMEQLDYVRLAVEKLKEWRKYGAIQRVYVDSANASFILSLKRELQRNNMHTYTAVLPSEKINKSLKIKTIADRIYLFNHIMALNKVQFAENVPYTIQSIKNATWDMEQYEKGKDEREDYPIEHESTDTAYIDLLDAMEYAIIPYTHNILQKKYMERL